MGSVGSLISGHNFHSKHCRASEHKSKKSSHLKKLNRYSDGLLRFGLSQDSTSYKSSSKMGKNEDFFYIKVSQKSRPPDTAELYNRPGGDLGDSKRPASMEISSYPAKLVPYSGQLEMGTDTNMIRPTAFKPVTPRNSSINLLTTTENHGSLNPIQIMPSVIQTEPENKPIRHSGAMSDSGRNSMSSLPTHSTNCSYQIDPINPSIGLLNKFGGSAQNISQCCDQQDSNMLSLKIMSFSDSGHCSADKTRESDTITCVRSPISTDETIVQQLEQKLLEKEVELQDLQYSFEEKEAESCQFYNKKQRQCQEEMEGLKQRCSSKLKQASQKAQKAQQHLQMQVLELQQEKKKLQDDMDTVAKERDLVEKKLQSYEKEQTNLAPTLEEAQWEVCQKSGEISLLKQQLKESQTDVNQKISEILSLRTQLKEAKGKIEYLQQSIQQMENSLHTRTVELEVCENELQRKKSEAELLREKVGRLEQEILDLKAELMLVKEQ
uniref:Leucine zipper tumor suppressor 1 n=1 Tax=Latimeria chalumnae TaxID=7897 RepID=H2ZY04_LATCH